MKPYRRSRSRISRIAVTLLIVTCLLPLACDSAAQSDFTGRWVHQENGESAELLLQHDRATGKVSGTFAALGKQAAVSGRADASALVIEKVGDVVASAENGTMVGAVSGEEMLLTIKQPGEDLVLLRLARQSGTGPMSNAVAASGSRDSDKPSSRVAVSHTNEEAYTPSGPEAFTGVWEAVSDDGTRTEKAELDFANGTVTGVLTSLERGYYSGRVTVTAQVNVRGVPREGGLDLRAWDAESGSPGNAVSGRAERRGNYLIVRVGDGETDYARPGIAVVQSAAGSAAGASLARAIRGRIYSAGTQATGGGAFVGKRMRLALCSDGSIAFDVSDLASTGGADGVDMGNATSRRGQWDVALVAGMPVVRANWAGTGSSYSLTRYFRVQPNADGSSARIDGTTLPATGTC